MKLKDIIKNCGVTGIKGSPETEILGMTNDSRKVLPGSLFVAVTGCGNDGRAHIADALKAGAAAVMCEGGCEAGEAVSVDVADSRLAVAMAADNFYGHPSGRLKLVGITGTNGKTTTTTLIGEIFKNFGKTAYVVGNIGYPFTACAAKATADDVAVAEVSSFQLETIDTFHPHVAVMCNITEDHLNRHGTMEEYIRIKERIFENMGKDDWAVLNYDDEIVRGMAQRVHCNVAYFSRKQMVENGACVENGEVIFVLDGKKKRVIPTEEIYIPGNHNLENALAATALTMLAGVPANIVRHTLKTFKGVEHRIETVRTVDGVTYINDSKGTNVDASVQAVRAMKAGTVLLAGGYDKHCDFLPFAKEIKDSKIHTVVVLGDTADQIEKALREVGFESILRAGSFEEAVMLARSCAKPGENVLLSPACASFDMFKDFEQRGEIFKELVGQLQ